MIKKIIIIVAIMSLILGFSMNYIEEIFANDIQTNSAISNLTYKLSYGGNNNPIEYVDAELTLDSSKSGWVKFYYTVNGMNSDFIHPVNVGHNYLFIQKMFFKYNIKDFKIYKTEFLN